MKNVILTLCLIATFAIADGWKFPGWKSADVAAYQEAVETAQNKGELVISTMMLALTQNPPASFEEAKNTIFASLQSLEGISENHKAEKVKQYCYQTNQFMDEVLAYAKANPTSYDVHLAMRNKSEWSWTTISEKLLAGSANEKSVIRNINFLNELAVELEKSDSEVIEVLKKLNRIYSAKLIEDKEAWAPVVAQIRTLIEVYE